MTELELVRVDQDGEVLVLRAPDGTQFVLPVTPALRAAVRPPTEAPVHDDVAPGPSQVTAAPDSPAPSTDLVVEPSIRPRDIQARLRAGATVEELAPLAGMPVENVRRYEWPVIAERDHVIGRVRAHEVPGVNGTAELGEVADSRLAARGVTEGDALWTARREGQAPWVVEVRFSAGDRERSARWTFDPRARVVTPLDDEARWLGQPDDPVTPEVRGVPSLASRRGLPPLDEETDLLLDDLAGRRGHRPPTRSMPVVPRSHPASPKAPGAAAHPAGSRIGSHAESDGSEFEIVPLGDVPVRERGPLDVSDPEPAASEPDDGEHRASVVDLGRWNPRRSRDKWVAPSPGPGASQPTLLPVTGGAAPTPSKVAGPATGTMPVVAAPERDGGAQAPSSSDDGGKADDNPAPVAVNQTSAPETPSRGVPATRRSRKGRAQVPSWDEIVFGARPEPS